MLELVVSLPIILTALCLCLLLVHTYIRKIWVDHHLYQALICAAKRQPIHICKENLIQQSKKLYFLGKIQSIQLKGGGNKWTGHVRIKNTTGQFVFQNQIHLDL